MAMIRERGLTAITCVGRATLLLGTALGLSGCVFFNPYIDRPGSLITVETPRESRMPTLLQAAQNAEALRDAATENRDQLVVGQSVLQYATFGAAAAGGVAALYGAHSDLVLGLGLGGASAFAAESLFASPTLVSIYSDADTVFGCIAQTALGAVSAEIRLTKMKTGSNGYAGYDGIRTALFMAISSPEVAHDEDLENRALAAIAQYDGAAVNLMRFIGSDVVFAQTVTNAISITQTAMNKRIDDSRANIEAILATAKNIGSAGMAMSRQQTLSAQEQRQMGNTGRQKALVPQAGGSTQTPRKATDAEIAQVENLIAELTTAAAGINAELSGITNAVNEVGTNCVLSEPSPGKLAVQPKALTLAAEQTAELTIAGGKAPYKVEFVPGKSPGEGIEIVYSTGNRIVLVAKSAVTPGTYELRVTSLPRTGEEITVAITVPAPAAPAS
ncbi:MAG: hypothetical protein NXI16_14930 [Alphaproteobacteria bacterium]|nr:hypothetical protein [Alphaproteobacteria bacterium]